ncbi:MAG: hypothetical protein C3F06_00800 [Candidatus Methanoperedenaceae archaeon]|nr:MAG: hypothetical protein C3F06_00800 [Candidatus Methanoperedenaceae archaeon]
MKKHNQTGGEVKKMITKYESGINMQNGYKFYMNNIFNVVLLLLISALVIMPEASANSGYFGALQSVYGTTGTSCSTCHTSPPALNSYGNAFAAITSHSSNPAGALLSIGVPPGVPAPADTIPPETNISGVTENGSYNTAVTITLTATDNMGGSGVRETMFSTNGGPATKYSIPFVVNTNGQNNVTYWSIDNAGNIEVPAIVNFTIANQLPIDTIPPQTNINGVTENGLYNNNATITLTAMDNPGGSGVKETIFSVNGGQTTTYTVPFIVDTIGRDSVAYWSTDNAGNIEPQKTVYFTITSVPVDVIPPETNISGVIEKGLYNNNVAIALTAADNPGGSGVKETIFSVNGGQTTTYTVPFIVDIIGQDSVTYWSKDVAGNIESPKMVNFTIISGLGMDIIPPITNIWGVAENGSYNNVTISLTATDNPGGSGVNETFFSVNGGNTTTYTVPFVVDTFGQNNVTYFSTDYAGNIESQKMVNFTFVQFMNATRKIESTSILPGESTDITISITSSINQALNLHEDIPEGWNVTYTSDDGFKNSTHEWILLEMLPGIPRNITYTLTSPANISIGTYQIIGTISNDGIVQYVSGDEGVKIDILEFYRRLGNNPDIIETGDLMQAINDSRNAIIPFGFDRPLNAQEVGELVNEWINT